MSRIAFHVPRDTVTPASGTATVTISPFHSDALSKLFQVVAATVTTTFDVKLTDKFGDVIYEFLNVTGELRERDTEIPIYGDVVMTISNASADELFTHKIAMLENV